LDTVTAADDRSSLSATHDVAVSWMERYHYQFTAARLFGACGFLDRSGLELGAGCGAITRTLGERFDHVDAIEGSVQRARICAKRCEDLASVRGFAADIDKIIPRATIRSGFSVGVWSGARILAGAILSPLSTNRLGIERRRELGRAIENQLGIKYFLGSGEDQAFRWKGFTVIRAWRRQRLLPLKFIRITQRWRVSSFTFSYPFPITNLRGSF
jgi:hypothetical protein